MELTIDRAMRQTRTSDSNGECEITLYNHDWDLRMGTNELPDGLEDLFPPAMGSKDGFQDFLGAVKVIQDFLDKIPN